MAGLQRLRQRIRSVSTTRQITKAMQLVAASRLRQAEAAVEQQQGYGQAVSALLLRVQAQTSTAQSPLYAIRPVRRGLVIVVGADRGLAGPYTSAVARKYSQLITASTYPLDVISVGSRAALRTATTTNVRQLATFRMDGPDPLTDLARPIATLAIDQFLGGQADTVTLLFTHFHSSLQQEVTTEQLLPAAPQPLALAEGLSEPGLLALLDTATRRQVESRVLAAVLESRAAEQSARMIAMLNATDNASDLIDNLTASYHGARQAGITQELAELASGLEALGD